MAAITIGRTEAGTATVAEAARPHLRRNARSAALCTFPTALPPAPQGRRPCAAVTPAMPVISTATEMASAVNRFWNRTGLKRIFGRLQPGVSKPLSFHRPPMPRRSADKNRRKHIALLVAIAAGSVMLWQTAIGSLALYPFTILATWFHEMGHGLTAMLVGARFENLVIFADGSGVALSSRASDASRLTHALISAGGPLGPAIAGSLLIIASRSEEATRVALTALGVALIISTAIWVRSLTGWLVLPAMGLAILLLAHRGTSSQRRFGIQLLGVQACISVWQQFGYLFSSEGSVGGQLQRSDTAAIADALLLPYWFWGTAISAIILGLLWWSLTVAFRRQAELY